MPTSLITDPIKTQRLQFKYLNIMGMVWVSFLIICTITSAKTFDIGPFSFSVGVVIYPITYVFADIFTEVYGYSVTRRIVWTGLLSMVLVSLATYVFALIPPSAAYTDNEAFRTIFLGSPIFAFAAVCCFFAGEFTNSYVLAKMKILTQGKYLSARLIASTLAGQSADNFTFYTLALVLGGFFSLGELPRLIISSVIACTLWEMIAAPLVTTHVIRFLKRSEGIDVYDRHTNFNPFVLKR